MVNINNKLEIHLETLDRELAFNVKIQISLIKNAERVMNLYPEKKGQFLEYIEERKNKIRAMGYHYLTLKPKKISPYKKELSYFKKQYDAKNVEIIKIDDNIYYCAKMKVENEIHYIYFSNDL
ncbi:MAG: hypothetical protein ACP5RY_06855 [Thermoplasmata archaeon]